MTDANRLAELEKTIESGLRGDVAAGEALEEINGERLYRETHASFDGYCRERWGFAANYAYRLIDAARTARKVLPVGNTFAPSERVLRAISPLAKKDPGLAHGVWRGLVERHGDGLTAAHVEYEVRSLLRSEGALPEPGCPDPNIVVVPPEADLAEPGGGLEEEAPERNPETPLPARPAEATPAARRPTPAREGGVKRPIFPYAGSKWRLAPRIVEMFPKHRVYVEPYLGSAAVFLTKRPVEREVLNDVDSNVINAFEVIRTRPDELAAVLTATLYSRTVFDEARRSHEAGEWTTLDELERARLFLVMAYQGYRRQARGRVYRATSYPTAPDVVGQWGRLPTKLVPTAERLKGARLEVGEALHIVREHRRFSDALIYCDPPYVLSSLRSGELYDYSMSDEEHEQLLDALREHPGPAFLSGYDSGIYRDALPGWELRELTFDDDTGEAVELLWLNGPAQAGARAADRRAADRERRARADGRISAPPVPVEPPAEAALFGSLLEGWRTG